MSTETESPLVCHLRGCVDGRQQEQLVGLSRWPLLTLFNTNVLLKILFQVNKQEKINTGFVFRFCLSSFKNSLLASIKQDTRCKVLFLPLTGSVTLGHVTFLNPFPHL